MNVLKMVERALVLGRRALSFCSGVALVMIMLGVSADAALRYLAGKPIAGMLEGVELLLVFAVFANLAQTQADGGNIRINILTERLKGRPLAAVRIVTTAAALGLFSAVTWATAGLAWRSWRMGEYAPGLFAFPIYPSRIIICVGCFYLCLQLSLTLVKEIGRLRNPPPDEASAQC